MITETKQNTTKSSSLSEAEFEALFRRLNLANTRRIYQEVARQAEQESWSYGDFLGHLLGEEVAHRKQTRLQRCTRNAHFPFFQTIEEFNFTPQSKLRKSLLGSYLGPDFVTEGRSLILHGKTGRGKTHLAVAIGYRAIQNGFEALFTTAAELIEDLSNASQKGRLLQSLITYTHPHVLIVDEVGYLTYGPDAANVLFHVVNIRHLKKRPMIFTTNKLLHQWGRVLHDEDLAAAILDRILERGRLLQLDGPSHRTRHLQLEEDLSNATESAKISGIGLSQFPEPTEVVYDPSQITYGQLLRVFFSVAHDPTELNRQGPDVGISYRSAIFYANDEQKHIATAYIEQLDAAKVFPKRIVTEVTPLKGFYRAEDYHQDYALKNPGSSYIQICDLPKISALKQQFPELFVDYKGK